MSKRSELNAEQATGKAMQEVNRRIANRRKDILKLRGRTRASEVADIMRDDFQAITGIVENQIVSAYLESYYRECYELQSQLRYYWKPRKMNQSNINAFINNKIAGENWKDRLQENYRDYATDISTILSLGEVNHIKRKEIADMIKAHTGTVGESGLTYKIMRIMRTETNNAVNRACIAAMKQASVKRYRVIAILDDRTCNYCHNEQHGRVYAVSQAKAGKTLPPFHPNCRCYIIPIINDEARRKAEKKGTKEKLGYYEWRRKYVDGDELNNETDREDRLFAYDKAFRPRADESERGKENLRRKLKLFYGDLKKHNDLQLKKVLRESFKRTDFVSSTTRSIYKPSEHRVYVSKNAFPDTIAHELFHEIDDTYSLSAEGAFTLSLSRDYLAIEVAAQLAELSIEKFLIIRYPNIFLSDKEDDEKVFEAFRGISDILNACSHGKIDLGYHHKPGYWEEEKRIEQECFAQYGKIMFSDDQLVIELFKELFPNFYLECQEVIKGL